MAGVGGHGCGLAVGCGQGGCGGPVGVDPGFPVLELVSAPLMLIGEAAIDGAERGRAGVGCPRRGRPSWCRWRTRCH